MWLRTLISSRKQDCFGQKSGRFPIEIRQLSNRNQAGFYLKAKSKKSISSGKLQAKWPFRKLQNAIEDVGTIAERPLLIHCLVHVFTSVQCGQGFLYTSHRLLNVVFACSIAHAEALSVAESIATDCSHMSLFEQIHREVG